MKDYKDLLDRNLMKTEAMKAIRVGQPVSKAEAGPVAPTIASGSTHVASSRNDKAAFKTYRKSYQFMDPAHRRKVVNDVLTEQNQAHGGSFL
jgi:hypothetical protein